LILLIGVTFRELVGKTSLLVGEFYGGDYFLFMGFLVGYLFLSLLVVVGLIQLFKGPLREIS
jgi:hypothetical protein